MAGDAEIIVVDNSGDRTLDLAHGKFPGVKLISSQARWIPQLWEEGIQQSCGEVIALTTAHCVPQKDWIGQIHKAHKNPYAGIGGAIENDGSGGIVEWAIYFLRYSRHMLPFLPEIVAEIAADNASYKRKFLDCCQGVRRNGFWEPVVHAELRRAGQKIWRTPAIVVTHKKSFGLFRFLQQRFWHGRQFGSGRSANLTKSGRMVHVILSPLIPGAYLSRIIQEIGSKRKHLKQFFFSLPILLLFLGSWSLGECSGYLWPSRQKI